MVLRLEVDGEDFESGNEILKEKRFGATPNIDIVALAGGLGLAW